MHVASPPVESAVTVVVADRHPLVVAGMAHVFQAEPNVEVLGRHTDDEHTWETVVGWRPSVLVADANLPRGGAIGLAHRITEAGVDTRVVLLADEISHGAVVEALRLGVKGVVLKDMEPKLLVHCVRQVARGGLWIEKYMLGKVMERMVHHQRRMQELRERLTPRELQILGLVTDGLANKDITARLDIAEGTVKIHLHNIYEKLGMPSRVALAAYARCDGPI